MIFPPFFLELFNKILNTKENLFKISVNNAGITFFVWVNLFWGWMRKKTLLKNRQDVSYRKLWRWLDHWTSNWLCFRPHKCSCHCPSVWQPQWSNGLHQWPSSSCRRPDWFFCHWISNRFWVVVDLWVDGNASPPGTPSPLVESKEEPRNAVSKL